MPKPTRRSVPAMRRRDAPGAASSAPGPIAVFEHAPRRTIPFVFMLAMLIVVGFIWLAETGVREGWAIAFLFIGMPAIALAAFMRDMLRKGPVLVVTRDGFVDRRRSEELIPWDRIADASAKGRLFSKGVSLILTDGERRDIDLALLNAEPRDILRLIHDGKERASRGS